MEIFHESHTETLNPAHSHGVLDAEAEAGPHAGMTLLCLFLASDTCWQSLAPLGLEHYQHSSLSCLSHEVLFMGSRLFKAFFYIRRPAMLDQAYTAFQQDLILNVYTSSDLKSQIKAQCNTLGSKDSTKVGDHNSNHNRVYL